ncbi:hypothetical protein [Clostridium beijerinckii]|uniref:Uncharacterized protein n=1 Tax=Clostridium beijerinckii TaxID=1520 RepID=A0A1S8RIN1_CLOBE|nr:hypothetical protein [Clostridium beijerinckii]NRY60179.1 hypothetical protein [Clostridium beijerinckii]OOM53066.1 hypothetical protein CLBCK_48180 [Clostridium beijerinckii]
MRIGELEIAIIDIITFIGLLITFLTGVLNLFQNKKTLYINNITRFRVIWITTLRTHISSLKELSNITNLYIRTKDGTNKIEYRRELEKVVSLIKMHLNFTGNLDCQLICKVDALKATLNSYLLAYYCKNTINKAENDNEVISKFKEVIDVVTEKKLLEQLLNIAISNKKNEVVNESESTSLSELKNAVKLAYISDSTLIKHMIKEIDYMIINYENEIESLNCDIDKIVQIYLKAEWIRCKEETRMWPKGYNEEKIIKKLQKEYEEHRK